ncbi:MAG: glycogen debranching enzyme N-terminal domain-containing protein [Armatimonadetes bacterium]|nr:glycogen debranching enzyme N-terminal domain-containing protein [Armatimonadota bacterium]
MKMVEIDASTLGNWRDGLHLEWLETNGLGGYAMGTVSGANARRYHGILCAAVRPPVDRRMLLNKLEDVIYIDGSRHALSCNLYGDVVHPEGYHYLRTFRLDPWPIWTYEMQGTIIEKHLIMPHGRNAVAVAYHCVESPCPIRIEGRLLASWRDHHHLAHSRVDISPEFQELPGGARISINGGPPVFLQAGDGRVSHCAEWYYNLTYPLEAERGLDFQEDLYCPVELEWPLCPGQTCALVACVDQPLELTFDEIAASERARREAVVRPAPADDPVARRLFLAADQFIVDREVNGAPAKSVIAGYPWFTDWGRDTLIALPGLLLATGRHEDARQVLIACAESMQDGLVPNLFPDQGIGAAYNTVDATLWFFAAAKRYYEATCDLDLFREVLFARMRQSLAAHIEGTHFGIRMTDDALLTAGDETTQLTWMDAKVGDWVVTPRHGKAVEVNALWYSALRTAEYFARKLDRDARPYARLCRRAKEAFLACFWLEDRGYLADVVRDTEIDASLRPNQVIALSLPYTMLSVAQERSVLKVVTEQLLTPYGLRTLAPSDDRYRGKCEGDPWSRDGAYHQGTVWTWPLGAFLSAYFTHAGRSEQARQWVGELIRPLVNHLREAGLGSVSEIFDGDPPHTPRGCPAQAWSVAELLRIWLELGLGGPKS